MRPGHRGAVRQGRLPRRAVPDPAGRRRLGERGDRAAARRPRVGAVTLTGSERGRGRRRRHRRAALEEVRPGAGRVRPVRGPGRRRPRLAAEAAARARFLNGGQSCIAACGSSSRSRGRRVRAALRRRRGRPPVGDPLDPATRIGPLARADLLDALERQVEGLRPRGQGAARRRPPGPARLVLRPDGPGRRHPGHAGVHRGDLRPGRGRRPRPDTEAAVALANDTPMGSGPASGPATWSAPGGWAGGSSPARCSSTPWSPPTRGCRSGIKRSGYGRELAAVGIRSSPTSAPLGPARRRTPPATLTE